MGEDESASPTRGAGSPSDSAASGTPQPQASRRSIPWGLLPIHWAMTGVAMGLVLSRVYLPSGVGIPLWLVFPHCQRMEVKGASVLP